MRGRFSASIFASRTKPIDEASGVRSPCLAPARHGVTTGIRFPGVVVRHPGYIADPSFAKSAPHPPCRAPSPRAVHGERDSVVRAERNTIWLSFSPHSGEKVAEGRMRGRSWLIDHNDSSGCSLWMRELRSNFQLQHPSHSVLPWRTVCSCSVLYGRQVSLNPLFDLGRSIGD